MASNLINIERALDCITDGELGAPAVSNVLLFNAEARGPSLGIRAPALTISM